MAKNKPAENPSNDFWPALFPCAALALVILLIFIARVRLLDAPLERDEGEYAYMGQLLLQGIPPYATAANMKFPGASAAYAVVMAIFGQSVTAIHLGLLLVNAAAVWLVFLLGRRLFTPVAGLAAAAAYAVLSSAWPVNGMWAHATHFVVLPALAATLLLLQWSDSPRPAKLFWSGILFGLAILMKQHGIFFALFGGLYLLNQSRQNPKQLLRDAALFSIAVVLPFAAMAALLARAGVFDKFWFWTVTYASQYATAIPLSSAPAILFNALGGLAKANWAVWLAALAGLALLCREKRFLIPALLAASFLAVCPGFYFRGHYFVLILPAMALGFGAAATFARPAIWPLWTAAAVLLFSVFEQSQFLFELTPVQATSAVYGANPFPEAVEIGRYIQTHSANDAKIAILGSEPEIFFYAQRQSAAPHLYAYPLMENHPFALRMQEEFIQSVESAKPEYAVLVNVDVSWLRTPQSPTRLFEWWAAYGAKNYEQAGVVDILPNGSAYHWDAAYKPRSSAHVIVFKRR